MLLLPDADPMHGGDVWAAAVSPADLLRINKNEAYVEHEAKSGRRQQLLAAELAQLLRLLLLLFVHHGQHQKLVVELEI